MNEQLSIFENSTNKYTITKPIRLIQLFSGIGMQQYAIKKVFSDCVNWRTCEWAIPSIIGYDKVWNSTDSATVDMPKNEIVDFLFKKGISIDYDKPATLKQISRMPLAKLKLIYSSIIKNRNLVNIMNVNADDLQIEERDKYCYIMTYSFPCQDLSTSGKRKGFEISQAEGGTRSGLVLEVIRILNELRKRESLPQILLMENVSQIHNKHNNSQFQKIINDLSKLGYSSFYEDMNSKNYGIPQNRNRTFMLSILGDYDYSFPHKERLKVKLKDILEEKVSKKYYLSEKMLNYMLSNSNGYEREKIFLRNIIPDKNIAFTLTTKNGTRACDTFIPIKNATKQGYLLGQDGDGVDISTRMHDHRGTVQKGITQTITTQCNNGVIVKNNENYIKWKEKGKFDLDCRAYKENRISATLTTTGKSKVLMKYFEIRRLTPLECCRLMGLGDEVEEKLKTTLSETSRYHIYGDGLVVQCVEKIFQQLKLF